MGAGTRPRQAAERADYERVEVVTDDNHGFRRIPHDPRVPTKNRERVLAVLVHARCGLSPKEIAAQVGLSHRAVGEHLQRLWAMRQVSPVDPSAPHPGGRFRERRWKAGRDIPWQPSDAHKRLLRQLPRPNSKQLGVESLAKTLGMSHRKVTVMLHDLRAAHLVQCYKSIDESDFRREITGWRRSPRGQLATESP